MRQMRIESGAQSLQQAELERSLARERERLSRVVGEMTQPLDKLTAIPDKVRQRPLLWLSGAFAAGLILGLD